MFRWYKAFKGGGEDVVNQQCTERHLCYQISANVAKIKEILYFKHRMNVLMLADIGA